MLNSRKAILVAVVLLLSASVTAQAQFSTSSLPAGRFIEDPNPGALAPTTVTQNLNTTMVVTGLSLNCTNGGPAEWWRLYDLDDAHGRSGEFCVTDVDYGIEDLGGNQTLTHSVHCIAEGAPFVHASLDTQCEVVVNHTPTALSLHNVAFPANCCCDADTEDLAMEMQTQAGLFFVGANNGGETGPTYISGCSGAVPEPTDVDDFGFTTTHILHVTNADGTNDGGEQDGVPSSTGVGMVFLILVLLGSSAYFLRRRVTN